MAQLLAPSPGAAAAPSGRRRRSALDHFALLGLVVTAVLMLLPFAVVVLNALKSPQEYAAQGPLSLPGGVYLDGLRDFWLRVDFGGKLMNSLLISGSVAVLAVVLSVLNAYALGIGRVPRTARAARRSAARRDGAAGGPRLPAVLAEQAGRALRPEARSHHHLHRHPDGVRDLPVSSVMAAFPHEVLEAARVDGAGPAQILWRIVVPILRPSIAVLLVSFFIWTWNEFFLPLVFLISNDNQTVPVALGVLQGQRLMDATMTSASAALGVPPAVVFFLLFQRTLTRGTTMGAVK